MNPLAAAKCQLDAALGFFYPDVCQICSRERATQRDGYVGANCWRGLRFIKAPYCECCGLPYEGEITTRFECANCRELDLHFSQARAAVAAEGVALEVIHRYKYQRALWFEPFLADLLVRAAQTELLKAPWQMIVPVPLHQMKSREREFNQAERLARCLAASTGLPVRTDLVERIAPTHTQTTLSRAKRADNVKRAFAARKGAQLNGERVVLLDDVLTTGSTASACARVLRQLGAGDVCVWTVARGL